MSTATVHQLSHLGNKLSKRRHRHRTPTDPVEIARIEAERRRDPAKWGLAHDNLGLEANAEVVVEGETRKNTERAMRWDVFRLMLMRCKEGEFPLAHYEAVRRLERDIAILHRTQGITGNGPYSPDPLQVWLTEDFSINRLLAALRLYGRPLVEKGVLRLIKPHTAILLLALCLPEVVEGRRVNWQDTVKRLTGEMDRLERGKIVRAACADLAQAYQQIDAGLRRAAA